MEGSYSVGSPIFRCETRAIKNGAWYLGDYSGLPDFDLSDSTNAVVTKRWVRPWI
jgi:hypothetical protein